MNEPPKTLTQAVDDLRLIRQVLDQTATSFRTLAPEFFRMGVVWLVYGVLSCLVIWPDTLAFLFPEAFAGWDPTTGVPRVLSALLPWARWPCGATCWSSASCGSARRAPSPPWGGRCWASGRCCWCSTSCCSCCWRGASSTTPPCPCPLNPQVCLGSRLGPLLLQPALPAHPLPRDPPSGHWDPAVGAAAVCAGSGGLCPGCLFRLRTGLVPVLATILPLYAFLVGVGLVQVFYQPVALLVLARRLRRRPEGV